MTPRPTFSRVFLSLAVLAGITLSILSPDTRQLLAAQGLAGYTNYTPPPMIVSSRPADGAAAVPVEQPLTVQFDRPMDTRCQVQLADAFGNANLPGQTRWSQTMRVNDTLTFVPDTTPLRYSMGYTLTLHCHDTNGIAVTGYERAVRITFATLGAPNDSSAPRVMTTAPYSGQASADASPIRIIFDKPIAPATLNPQSVSLTGTSAAAYRLQPQGFQLAIWPQDVPASAQYQVNLDTRIADGDGHRLALPYRLRFTTGAGNKTSPTVTQTRPADQSAALDWEPVSVFFSERMDANSIDTATVQIVDETAGDTPVGIHIEKTGVGEDGERAKIEIDRAYEDGGRWLAGHTYRVALAPTIADLAGNVLGMATVFRFTVASAPDTPPAMIGEGNSLAYRQADGRVTLELAVNAASSTGGALRVTVQDQPF